MRINLTSAPSSRRYPLVAIGLLWGSLVGDAVADQSLPLPPDAAAVHELSQATRGGLDARDWRLDPAVFTDITPFTAPDIAVQLPSDQQEQEPGAAGTKVPASQTTSDPNAADGADGSAGP